MSQFNGVYIPAAFQGGDVAINCYTLDATVTAPAGIVANHLYMVC